MGGTVPDFPPIPDADLRSKLAAADWEEPIAVWTSLVELRGDQPPEEATADAGLVTFLTALMERRAEGDVEVLARKESSGLFGACLTVIYMLCETVPPAEFLTWEFLADFAAVYSAKRTAPILESLFATHRLQIEKSLSSLKKALVRSLDAVPEPNMDALASQLVRLRPLVDASPAVASHLLAGSDFLDGLVAAYRTTHPPLRAAILSTAYLCLVGLTKGANPRFSMLGDQLYALKSAADAHRAGPLRAEDSLVPELVSTLPLLSRVRSAAERSGGGTATLEARLESLAEYRRSGALLGKGRKMAGRSRFSKGKGVALELELGDGSLFSAKRMDALTGLQEIFPDLGQGFLSRLLDEYDDSPEQVTSHFVDESLPEYLVEADRDETLDSYAAQSWPAQSSLPTPDSDLPARRNVFNDDELDRLEVDVSKLRFSKAPEKTAEDILNDKAGAPSKDAIRSALAAFDSDDDERDDTYDTADVGGAIDVAANEEADARDDMAEGLLYRAYQTNPAVFGRNNETRISPARARLRKDADRTDEEIEGWALVLERDPQLKRRLATRYSVQQIYQREVQSTAWRGEKSESEDEEDEGEGAAAGMGRGGFGGRGRGRGRGGSVDGPAGDRDTEAARRRKEANKGSRANHNRRDGRARKMARGGLPG